jgi:hypothetical protein
MSKQPSRFDPPTYEDELEKMKENNGNYFNI